MPFLGGQWSALGGRWMPTSSCAHRQLAIAMPASFPAATQGAAVPEGLPASQLDPLSLRQQTEKQVREA